MDSLYAVVSMQQYYRHSVLKGMYNTNPSFSFKLTDQAAKFISYFNLQLLKTNQLAVANYDDLIIRQWAHSNIV